MPYLLIRKGANPGKRFPLAKNRIVLGREKDCDIVLVPTDATRGKQKDAISRKHAIISRENDDYFLEDGNGAGKPSHNGTFVNDAPVPPSQRVRLKTGDTIRICDFQLEFYDVAPEPDSGSINASVDHDSSLYLTQPEDKLKLLLKITNRLSNTLELDALLPEVVDNLLQIFKQADRGFLILREKTSGKLVCGAFQVRKPEGEEPFAYSESIVTQCLQKRKGLLSNDVPGDYPGANSVTGLALRSVMCAPLCTHEGEPFGVLQLDSHDPRRKFTEEDLNLLMGVATQASIALTNAQFHHDALERERQKREEELERERRKQEEALAKEREATERERVKRDLVLASQIVKAFLPERFPEIPGYEFFARCESALEVGGDYYDLVPLPGGRLGILVGDVAGKGVSAALVMARFSAEARACLQTEPKLEAAVRQLNTLMQPLSFTDRFVTLAALLLDPATHTLTVVNAGHPPPLVVQRDGAVAEATPRDVVGLPLGVMDNYDYQPHQLVLQPGETLVMFSDGVPDAMDVQDKEFGPERLCDILARNRVPPAKLGECVMGAVATHAAGRSQQHDDITLLCFGRL